MLNPPLESGKIGQALSKPSMNEVLASFQEFLDVDLNPSLMSQLLLSLINVADLEPLL